MAKILLYNIKEEEKLTGIRLCALKQGVETVVVSPEDFSKPLKAVLGLESDSSIDANAPKKPFEGEMLVMHALDNRQFNGFLDSLRSFDISVPLKAVVTDTNISWSSEMLHRELSSERKAISSGHKSVHRKKG